MAASVLDVGVGPSRKRAILCRFGSLRWLRIASIEEIAEVKSVLERVARDIWKELRAWDQEREEVADKAQWTQLTGYGDNDGHRGR